MIRRAGLGTVSSSLVAPTYPVQAVDGKCPPCRDTLSIP